MEFVKRVNCEAIVPLCGWAGEGLSNTAEFTNVQQSSVEGKACAL